MLPLTLLTTDTQFNAYIVCRSTPGYLFSDGQAIPTLLCLECYGGVFTTSIWENLLGPVMTHSTDSRKVLCTYGMNEF
jgi:hypothetical protein